jgi:hypothetical protein
MQRRLGFGPTAVVMAVAATALLVDGRTEVDESTDREDDDATVEIEIVLTEE